MMHSLRYRNKAQFQHYVLVYAHSVSRLPSQRNTIVVKQTHIQHATFDLVWQASCKTNQASDLWLG